MEKRKSLRTKFILDVALAFSAVVLIFVVSDFYYERRLIKDALTEKLKNDMIARLHQLKAELKLIPDEAGLLGRAKRFCGKIEFNNMVRLPFNTFQYLAVYDSEARQVVGTLPHAEAPAIDQMMVSEAIHKGMDQADIYSDNDGRLVLVVVPFGTTEKDVERSKAAGALAYCARPSFEGFFTTHLNKGLLMAKLVGFGLVLLVLFMVIEFVTRTVILEPLKELILHHHAAVQGDLRRYEGKRPSNEIGDLFMMFDRVLDTLSEKEKRLKELEGNGAGGKKPRHPALDEDIFLE